MRKRFGAGWADANTVRVHELIPSSALQVEDVLGSDLFTRPQALVALHIVGVDAGKRQSAAHVAVIGAGVTAELVSLKCKAQLLCFGLQIQQEVEPVACPPTKGVPYMSCL